MSTVEAEALLTRMLDKVDELAHLRDAGAKNCGILGATKLSVARSGAVCETR